MYVDFSAEQNALRMKIRDFYRELMTPEVREALGGKVEELGGSLYRKIVEQMGSAGWLGIGWPTEYGGQGRGPIEQFIFWDETYRARAPLPIISVNTIGPTLIRFGTEEQKRAFLPGILAGQLHFAVGYTEPTSGTDLASLRTRAVRDGDEWVINGQKIFTTFAHDADYVWLAARTDPDAPKHKGISMILVPCDSPGYSHTPIYTLGGERTNATYFEDVRVPYDNLVGPENGGWGLIVSQLNHERITLATPGIVDRCLDEVWNWAAQTESPEGGRMLDQEWVQQNLARVYAKLEAVKVLNWRSAWALEQGIPRMEEASAVKVMGTEFFVEAYRLLLEITNAAGLIPEGEPGAMFGGILEQAYRGAATLTFGGGVNEVQRDIIAGAALGLPRARR